MAATIPDSVINVIDALEEGENLNAKLTRLAESEIRRRLARYELTARLMQAKYGMSLQEFEAQGVVAESGYSWEVENDHQDWDLAVDGIRTMQQRLDDLQVAM